MDAAWRVGLSVLVLVVVLVAVRQYIQSLRARGREALERRFSGSEVLLTETLALSFGRESKGVMQLRGSGVLALSAKELFFLMYVPARELPIPLASIKAVSLVRSHLGKAQGVDLLHVRFAVDGVEDAIAWRVPDPRTWQATLDTLLAKCRAEKLSGQGLTS